MSLQPFGCYGNHTALHQGRIRIGNEIHVQESEAATGGTSCPAEYVFDEVSDGVSRLAMALQIGSRCFARHNYLHFCEIYRTI